MVLPVIVREVWRYNLEKEISAIVSSLTSRRFVAIDTEFPGLVFGAKHDEYSRRLSPYQLMKANVEATQIIQLGLALCDANGGSCCVWEFNFRDFDDRVDSQNPESIELLKRQGINLHKNRVLGIHSSDFARLIVKSGLFCSSIITWATFHGTYDLGYLIRILIQRELPNDLNDFMGLVKHYFGEKVFDIKHMIQFCDGLHGGLERVAKSLGVDRVAGKSHQAGSDSLLTLQTFMKLKDTHFHGCLRAENHQAAEYHKLTLIAKFSQGCPPVDLFEQHVNSSWGLAQPAVIELLGYRHLYVHLKSEEDFAVAWSRESHIFQNRRFLLFRWTPDFNKKRDSQYAAMWLRLPRLDLPLQNLAFLERIGNALGRFLCADERTKKLKHPIAPRICVEMDLSEPLPDKLRITVETVKSFWQKIKYDSNLGFCSFCHLQGHVSDVCRKRLAVTGKQRILAAPPPEKATPNKTGKPGEETTKEIPTNFGVAETISFLFKTATI